MKSADRTALRARLAGTPLRAGLVGTSPKAPLLAACLVLALLPSAQAAPPRPGGPPAGPPREGGERRVGAPGERPGPPDEDLRETITLLMMVRMKNELELSKQQYEQILPKVDECERARASSFRERHMQTMRLRELLTGETARDSDLQEAVDRLIAQDEAERHQEEAFVAEVRKLLSPRQQAKFLLFRQRFRQWLEGRMRDARALRGGGPPGPGGPLDFEQGPRGVEEGPEVPAHP